VIRWLAPAALAAAVLLAGPILVHMLLRRNARRVIFPAIQFLQASRAAAVRFRRPSDAGLMILRLAIVAAAVAAAAQPVLIARWRMAQWDARTIRAVIVDTRPGTAPRDDAIRLAEEEMRAFKAQRFSGEDLPGALARAAAWFAQAPPGRREVVVVSDFRKGSLDGQDFGVLPSGVGVRTIRAGTQPAAREVTLPTVSGRGGAWQPSMRVERGGTAVTWTRTSAGPAASWLSTAQAPEEAPAAERALKVAAAFGVAAGDDTRRVHVRFAGAPADSRTGGALRASWMVDSALALRRSRLLHEANAAVTTRELDGRLVVETTVRAASAEAAAILRAVVLAVRPASMADRAAEVTTVSDAELAAWRKDVAPVSAPPADPFDGFVSDSDARWLWLAALALLGVETWARRARERTGRIEVRDAA